MTTWAIVPLKSPDAAKSRLAPVLTPTQRRALFFALAHRVIGALTAISSIDRIGVVTASEEVASFARKLGCDVIMQLADAGTAQAFEAAVAQLHPLHLPRLLMIAGDLPLITPQVLQQLLDAAGDLPGIVIAPDRRSIGTNALLCTPPDAIAPCFGADSFRRHRAAADALGLPVRVVDVEELALDLDVADDLDHLRTRLDPPAPFDLAPHASIGDAPFRFDRPPAIV